MDHLGISHAMEAMVDLYRRASRRTGRTDELLEILKDGDRVVCSNPSSATDLRRRIGNRDLKVEVVVIPVIGAGGLLERRLPEGRTIFDHTWVEDYYEMAIRVATKEIDHLHKLASQNPDGRRSEMNDLNRSRFGP